MKVIKIQSDRYQDDITYIPVHLITGFYSVDTSDGRYVVNICTPSGYNNSFEFYRSEDRDIVMKKLCEITGDKSDFIEVIDVFSRND